MAETSVLWSGIELLVNDHDQEHAFTVLTSHGLIPSAAENDKTLPPTSFASWRQTFLDHKFKFKIDVISATACQSMKSHPNLSIEFTGLAPLPTPTSYLKLLSPPVDNPSEPQYVPPSALLKVTGKEDNPTDFASCLLPTFPRLVESEMHILLQVCSPDSLEWVQHMAQFSALVHSSSCPGGLDHVPDIVAPKFHNFVKWIQLARKGQRDYHALACLQEEYRQHGASAKSIVTCQSTLTVQKRKSLVCLIM